MCRSPVLFHFRYKTSVLYPEGLDTNICNWSTSAINQFLERVGSNSGTCKLWVAVSISRSPSGTEGLTNRRLVDSCCFCSFSAGEGRRTLRHYRIYSNLTNQVQYILNIRTEYLFALLQTSSSMYRGFYLNSVSSHDVD